MATDPQDPQERDKRALARAKTLPCWQVRLDDLGVHGLSYAVRVEARDPNAARALVVSELQKAGIKVPYGAVIHVSRADEDRARREDYRVLTGGKR